MLRVLCVSALLTLCLGCGGKSERGRGLLPPSNSKAGSLLIVIDSVLWREALGRAFRRTFAVTFPGIPRPEPYFDISQVDPRHFNRTLRRRDKVMIVGVEDRALLGNRRALALLGQQVRQEIGQDKGSSFKRVRDVFAKDQTLWLWWGKEEALIRDLSRYDTLLRGALEDWDLKRLRKRLFVSEQKSLRQALFSRHGISLRVPKGYDVAKEEKHFVWLRHMDRKIDRHLFWHTEPYVSDSVFFQIPSYRDSLAQRYLVDGEKEELYVTYQKEMPFQTRVTQLRGHYAVEVRGLWKLSDSSNGGPFLAYLIADTVRRKLYYVEGFVYCPSKRKRDLVWEMQTILHSFRVQ